MVRRTLRVVRNETWQIPGAEGDEMGRGDMCKVDPQEAPPSKHRRVYPGHGRAY